jgi:hypothetical protein
MDEFNKLFESFKKRYEEMAKQKIVYPDQFLTFNEWSKYIREQNDLAKWKKTNK